MLSPDQLKARENKLTASRVACLMTGDEKKIMDLWRGMVGDPDYMPEDLSDVWAVQLGAHTESLNLDWYERRTGRIVERRGEVVVHHEIEWAAATLDGWVQLDDTRGYCVETKHTGGFEPIETIIDRYMPQMHWQMFVTNSSRCDLSVIMGARELAIEVIEYDPAYANELIGRAKEFMACVESLTPPVALPPVAAPVKSVKTYSMVGNNSWANEAVTWMTTRQAARDNEAASKAIKAMVPADAVKCDGHGIQVSRSKAGALSIRETKDAV